MASRSGAVHVSTTRRHYKGKTYETHLLRRSFRDGKKVRHETLGNLSHLPPALLDVVRRGLKGESVGVLSDRFEILSARSHGHVRAVAAMMRKLGLAALLDKASSRERRLCEAMIAARVLMPASKLATTRLWHSSTLLDEFDVTEATEDQLYAAMDWLLEHQTAVEEKLAKRHLYDGALVLYDVTSSYLTGRRCPLARLGYSRDRRRGTLQIVYGLLCDRDGRPIAVEVFEGNTGDPSTMRTQIDKLRKRFGLKQIIFVGDRGMITSTWAETLTDEQLQFITCLRASAIQALHRDGVLQLSLFDQKNLVELIDPKTPSERLVACLNPLLRDERSRKREELLQATERELAKIKKSVESGRLRGAAPIGVRVGKVIERYKVQKHFVLDIADRSFSYRRDSDGISVEAALDGVYVIRSSVRGADMTAHELVRSYKLLVRVEQAFRSIKTVDLEIRPIHHRLERRVRAHVFLCMLAYYVQWHMMDAWRPLLFADDDLAWRQTRDPVHQAKPSPSAKAKAETKQLADGSTVHSLATLLADLANITKNRCRPVGGFDAAFHVVAIPTASQRRALDLLGVTL